ncbi:protein-tyrosine phosphatase-like, PTPLA [Kipferlia bialata]|uniref:very-long-chain (3R)-3-hydroxyacyl-CoA dehydratase n=1 Tax=Kipferlia bialata TaxID=797122 RepID=A0A9K3D489_9EUKA|nr:protein-tyrosine phosphatase-like, PTPLA [Kipferlia bialata]|eukprot:g10820.t1
MGLTKSYLLTYNAAQFGIWSYAVFLTLKCIAQGNIDKVYAEAGLYVLIGQTLMIMDVVHAALKMIRSNPVTAFLQIVSRVYVCWAVMYPMTEDMGGFLRSPVVSSLYLAWGVTEMIRYSYYNLNMVNKVPYVLSWIRYNAFLPLYPIGVASEMFFVIGSGFVYMLHGDVHPDPLRVRMPNCLNASYSSSAQVCPPLM